MYKRKKNMIEDIVLDKFPKEACVYLFKVNDEVIYVGSSKNVYMRMVQHRSSIRKGGNNNGTSKQELYKFLQSNHFTVEIQLTDNYKKLEQELIEQYNPKYNSRRANTGVAWNGNKAEYMKQYNKQYKEEILEQMKQYRESHKEQQRQYNKQYKNQLCLYKGEILTLNALSKRFQRAGIEHSVLEAKKYLINN